MNTHSVFGFDIEAIPLRLFSPEAKLLCASIGQEFAVTYCRDHPLTHLLDEETNLFNLAIIGTILKDPDNIISAHNISFDKVGWVRFFQQENQDELIQAKLFDTMIAHYLVGDAEQNNLNYVAKRYLGVTKLEIDIKNLEKVPIEQLILYNQIDSILHYRLYEPLMNELVDNGHEKLYKYLMKVLGILINMSIKGVNIDVEYIRKHKEEVDEKIVSTYTQLVKLFGDINFGSYQQLGKVLFEDLKLPILQYSEKGNISTNVDAITKLRNHPEVSKKHKESLQLLTDYRKLNKNKSTYFEPLSTKHLGYDGRIHTQYFLGKGSDRKVKYGTISGRTSSNNPNMQNVPNNVTIQDLLINVRQAFVCTPGYTIYKADYSQLEMRVAAFLSKDKVMLRVFEEGIDIHTYSLTGVYDEEYDFIRGKLAEDNKEWKRRRLLIKNFNFALIYGASPFKLQLMLLKQLEVDMPIDEVRRICKRWNQLYRKFTEWRYNVYSLIYQMGCVITETGRKRTFFEEGHGKDYQDNVMQQFYREGLNDLIQSFASDIALFGLIYMDKLLRKHCDGYPLLLVHDSIDGEVKDSSKLEWVCRQAMIHKPLWLLTKEFGINTKDLHLDIEVKTNLQHWS